MKKFKYILGLIFAVLFLVYYFYAVYIWHPDPSVTPHGWFAINIQFPPGFFILTPAYTVAELFGSSTNQNELLIIISGLIFYFLSGAFIRLLIQLAKQNDNEKNI